MYRIHLKGYKFKKASKFLHLLVQVFCIVELVFDTRTSVLDYFISHFISRLVEKLSFELFLSLLAFNFFCV